MRLKKQGEELSMSLELQLIINVLVTTLPYRFLAYYPLWKYIRFKGYLVISATIISEFVFIAWSLLFFNSGTNPKYAEIVFSIICFAIYCLFIKVDIFKLFFFYLFTVEYTMIIRGMAVFLTSLLFSEYSTVYYSIQNSIIQSIIFAVALPFMILFFRNTAERIVESPQSNIWKTIWMIPALTIFIILMFTGSLDNEITKNWTFLITRICLIICTFTVYYILLRSFDILREHAMLEERAKQAEAINDLQKAQYNLILKRIEETKIARHDLRQHLNLIQAYIDDGDQEALKNYLEAYKKTLPMDTSQTYCKNYAVDVLVRYYAEQAKINNINFYTSLDLPSELSVSEPDTCVIFGNLIENALEACQREKSSDKFIRICGQVLGGSSISLTIDNSCEKRPIQEGKEYVSSKRSEIGTGLISVKNIAEKYNGVTIFKYEDGIFFASVLLNPI